MKVLHILNELRPSGAEVMLKLSAAEWPSHGIQAEILTTGRAEGEYADALRQAGWTIHHLPFRKSPLFFAGLTRFLRQNRYDAVHLHAERAFPYFVLAAKAAGVPRMVRTIHNAFPFTGFLRQRRGVQRRMAARAGVVYTSVSRSVQRHERERFGIESVYIPNWYDAAHFLPPTTREHQAARDSLRISAGEFVLVSVSNCAPVKNHEGILEALAALPPSFNFRYLHVGHGTLEASEREYVSRAGMDSKVTFAGQQRDVRPFLWAADCFLMPSRYEGIGIAAIEAIATGLSCAFADVIGLQDFADWCTGIRWTSTTPSSIAEAIQFLAACPAEERRRIALADSEAIRKAFHSGQSIARFAKLYRGS